MSSIKRRFAALFVILAMSAVPPDTFAQAAPQLQTNWAAVQALKQRESIVVITADGTETKGPLRDVSETTLALGKAPKLKELKRENIVAIYSSRHSALKSTLEGAAIGAGGGAVFGAIAFGSCGGFCFVGKEEGVLVSTAVFSVPGALIGFLFGRLHSRQVPVYIARH